MRAEAERLAAAVQPVTPAATAAADSTASSSSPSRPGPTSHDVVGLVRRLSPTRRVGHGGTLDPFARRRAAGVPRPRDPPRRVPPRRDEALPRDDLLRRHVDDRRHRRRADAGRRAPRRRARPSRPASPRSPARSARSRRTTARSRSRAGAPTSWRARASPWSWPPRDVVIHAFDAPRVGRQRPGRPVAIVDVACSAGTYIRALARDLGDAARAAVRTSGRWCAPRRAASASRTPSGSTRFARTRPTGRRASRALLRPIDAGLEDLPHAVDHRRRAPPPGEGLITAPKTPLADPRRARSCSPSARTGGSRPSAGPSRARSTRTRCSPSARRRTSVRGRRPTAEPPPCRDRPGRAEPRRAGRCTGRRTASRSPRAPECGWSRARRDRAVVAPAFVVVGVFDGLHLGHAYLLDHLVAEATAGRREPVVITFDHHPDEVLTGCAAAAPVRPRRAPGAARGRRRRHDRRRPLRPAAARDARTRRSSTGSPPARASPAS